MSEKFTKARAQLALQYPFFATLTFGLVAKEDKHIPTCGTDGKYLYFNPDFFETLNLQEAVFALAHEGMHVALRHMTRRGSRDQQVWNWAGDYVINDALILSGFTMPQRIGKDGKPTNVGLHDQKYRNMSTEEVYRELDKDVKSGKIPTITINCCAGVRDFPGDPLEGEQEAGILVNQAMQAARSRGDVPAGVANLLDEVMKPKLDWRDILRAFIRSKRRDDYSIKRPNRRLLPKIYLPSLYNEGIGPVVLVRDTSGSTSEHQKQFAGECASIFRDTKPEKLYILDVDVDIHQVMELNAYDEIPEGLVRPKGYGGTSFKAPFRWVEERGVNPECLIYLTDMEGDFPDTAPSYPVLWISTTKDLVAPFGATVYMDEH